MLEFREYKKPLVLRIGDRWENTVNNGVIPRTIVALDKEGVGYRNASGHYRECSIARFRRWARSAELEFAHDWSGRFIDDSNVTAT